MNENIENWIDDKKRHQDSDNPKMCVLVVDIPELIDLIKNDIGIKDINDKLIYADSSIFEFDIDNDHKHANCISSHVGYFTYNSDMACNIIIYEDKNNIEDKTKYFYAFPCDFHIVAKNFNIIDTIQENKLGLMK